MVAHSKERLLREARRRGLIEPEDITAMQGLPKWGGVLWVSSLMLPAQV